MGYDEWLADDTRMVTCERCGEKFDLDLMNGFELETNDYMCPSCYDDSTVLCERCGERVWDGELYPFEGMDVCSNCLEMLEQESEDAESE